MRAAAQLRCAAYILPRSLQRAVDWQQQTLTKHTTTHIACTRFSLVWWGLFYIRAVPWHDTSVAHLLMHAAITPPHVAAGCHLLTTCSVIKHTALLHPALFCNYLAPASAA